MRSHDAFGDLAALYATNRSQYERFAQYLLGSAERGRHEDVVQEAMLKLMNGRAAGAFDEQVTHTLVLWAVRVVAVDELRRQGRRSHSSLDVELPDGGSLYNAIEDVHALSPSKLLENHAALQLVIDYVAELKPDGALRKAWEVRAAAGFDADEAKRLVLQNAGGDTDAWNRHTTAWNTLKRRLERLLLSYGFGDLL